MMKLRAWQSECVSTALKHFREQKHFLCLATPGAGKTTMSAELAARLIQQEQIDFILCFAPSVSVVSGLQNSFSQWLGQRFDGLLGAVGGAYTYQGMRSLSEEFWQIFHTHRVLVVFDEIHHCAGMAAGDANTWGEEILMKIQDYATYTLALTGTPWRSDNRPIVLSQYVGIDPQIHCHYSYGLSEAIKDGVCRKPAIVLIDNDRLLVKEGEQHLEYTGVEALLTSRAVRYQELLYNEGALRHCLSLGCQKLAELRKANPEAGGLVVASSIVHARRIENLLCDEFGQTVVTVTHKHRDAGKVIDNFRHSQQQWIVSVGMISEGTDIPRLQVCCHLSRITTELYFRQILGRVLRITKQAPNSAWLFTFAEPQLTSFAERVAEEVPANNVVFFETTPEFSFIDTAGKTNQKPCPVNTDKQIIFADENTLPIADDKYTTDLHCSALSEVYSLECLGAFRRRLVDLFDNALTSEAYQKNALPANSVEL